MSGVSIKDKVVLVSGSNRGIGKSFAIQALEMGAKKVYATARDESKLAELVEKYGDKIVPLTLDITNQDQVTAAAAAAGDVEVLINNSGMGGGGPMVGNPNPEGQRMEMEVNYFGIIRMCDAFAPILKANGGGAIVNILSVAGLSSFAFAPGYSASKAAGRSLTQALRVELAKQGTLVSGVFPGPVDTEMAKSACRWIRPHPIPLRSASMKRSPRALKTSTQTHSPCSSLRLYRQTSRPQKKPTLRAFRTYQQTHN